MRKPPYDTSGMNPEIDAANRNEKQLNDPVLFTTGEMSQMLSTSEPKLLSLLEPMGPIRCVNIGDRKYCSRDAVVEWIEPYPSAQEQL